MGDPLHEHPDSQASRMSEPTDVQNSLRGPEPSTPPQSWRGVTVAFTGGGSAGHVTPNLALIEALRARGGEAIYIGRGAERLGGELKPSVEQRLTEELEELPYYEIPSERLRRYFDWRNFSMPFTVLRGIWRAYQHLRALKPDLLFSKGGFVSLPVVLGAWLNKTPVVLHESDGTLGLANQLSLPFTKVVCVAQARARAATKHPFVAHTGTPIRQAFYEASAEAARERFGLSGSKPLLLVFGGSLGAQHINDALRGALSQLLEGYELFHVCGPGKVDPESLERYAERGYHQVEYVSEGFADLLSAARLVVGRAGANSVAELVLLKRPALLIPLPTQSSRGDQLLNAQEFEGMGFGKLLRDEQLSPESLLMKLAELEQGYETYVEAMSSAPSADGAASTLAVMRQVLLATAGTADQKVEGGAP